MNSTSSYKPYIVATAVITLITIISAATINYVIDPAHLFDETNEYEKSIARYLHSGKNVTNVSNYDERLTQEYFIEDIESQLDVIVLGSSRSMQIRGSAFEGRTYFNNSVSGASLEDHMAIYEMYRQKGFVPKTVIIGVDPWIFNENNGQTRWRSISEYLYDIGDRLSVRVPFQEAPGIASTRSRYSELFSYAYLEESISVIWRTLRRSNSGLVATDETHNSNNTKLSDGSLVYASAIRNRSQENVRIRATGNANRGAIYALGNFDKLNGLAVRAFDVFIQSIQNDGADPILLLPPYHPAAYEIMRSDHRYIAVLEAEEYIRQLGKDRNISVLGSYSPERSGCTDSQFTDEMHPRESCLHYILSKHALGP